MSVEIDPFVTVAFPVRSASLDRNVVFRVRVPTRRLRKEHRRATEDCRNESDSDKFWRIVKEGVEAGVVGWNESDPFSFEAVESKLDEIEIMQLFAQWPDARKMTESDKGKSGSPPDATSA